MIDNTQKQKILKKILQSEEFVHSAKHQKLLTCLFNASVNNHTLKESDIALYMFDRGADFDPASDTIVRVSMHNLRSKLERFYETEGKKEKIRIEIQKGHYEIKFIRHQFHHYRDYFSFFRIAVCVSILLIFSLMLYKILNYRKHINLNMLAVRESSFWSDIIDSKRNILIVIGDEFFFIQHHGLDQSVMRRHEINTLDDLDAFVATQPDSLFYRKTPYVFFPKISVWPLRTILSIINPRTSVRFKESSRLTSSDLLKENIIFLGSIRSLYLFDDLIEEAPYQLHWEADLRNQHITSHDSSLSLYFDGGPDKTHIDYCFLKKFSGPSGNTILMIFSCFEAGISGVTDIISNEKELQNLQKMIGDSLGKSVKEYSILFRTRGHARTALKTEIIKMYRIERETNLW